MISERNESRFFQVDAFSDKAFCGNPTGVCILAKPIDGNYLHQLASEFGFNETAFLVKQEGGYSVRFFTKFSEVAICAHGAIAAAHVLHHVGEAADGESILLKTAKNDILVTMEDGYYKVLFPEYQVKSVPVTPDFKEITGLNPVELYKCSHDWYLAYFTEHEDVFRALPHFLKMKHSDYGQLIITCQGRKGEADYVQRSFSPNHSVNEEDVSGSAQCALAVFWKTKLYKNEFISLQASSRGGVIKVRSTEEKMVEIMGKAIIVIEGKVLI